MTSILHISPVAFVAILAVMSRVARADRNTDDDFHKFGVTSSGKLQGERYLEQGRAKDDTNEMHKPHHRQDFYQGKTAEKTIEMHKPHHRHKHRDKNPDEDADDKEAKWEKEQVTKVEDFQRGQVSTASTTSATEEASEESTTPASTTGQAAPARTEEVVKPEQLESHNGTSTCCEVTCSYEYESWLSFIPILNWFAENERFECEDGPYGAADHHPPAYIKEAKACPATVEDVAAGGATEKMALAKLCPPQVKNPMCKHVAADNITKCDEN